MWVWFLLAAVPFADLPTFSVESAPDVPAVGQSTVDASVVAVARCMPRILRPWVSDVRVNAVPGHDFELKLFANESIRAAVRSAANCFANGTASISATFAAAENVHADREC